MPECVDLAAQFGKKYKIGRDPAAALESGGRRDPWLRILICRDGHVFPHSAKELCFWHDGRRDRLDKKCSELRLYQDGDDARTYLFSLGDFDRVAKWIKVRRRRSLSASQRAELADRARLNFAKNTDKKGTFPLATPRSAPEAAQSA